jgi:RNA polymerase sigma-70 factor, ECF subfamily
VGRSVFPHDMATLIHCMSLPTPARPSRTGPAQAGVSDDLEIAAGLRQRDPDLLLRLIEQYQPRLLRYLVSLTGDPALAEDLFQETWVRVLERGHRYDGRSRFVAWLLTVARNLTIDVLRQKRPLSLDALTSATEDRAPLQPPATGPGPYEILAARQQQDRLAAFVSCVPARYREVLVLRFHEDLSIQEIATVTGSPTSTVKTRIARGLLALRPRLEAFR